MPSIGGPLLMRAWSLSVRSIAVGKTLPRSETTMARFGVGVMHNTINSRFGPKPLVHRDYAIGLACRAVSFWVADHLNSAWPPSMWAPEHVGAARLIPKPRRPP